MRCRTARRGQSVDIDARGARGDAILRAWPSPRRSSRTPSPSTSRWRRYVLVSQHEALIEHYTRNDDGTWTLHEVRPPGLVRLSIGCELPAAAVFRDPLAPPAA